MSLNILKLKYIEKTQAKLEKEKCDICGAEEVYER